MATLVYYVDNNNGETNFVGLWASRKEAIETLKSDPRYGNPDGTNFFKLLKEEPNDKIGFIDFDWPVKLEDLYDEVLWKIMAAGIEPFDWPNRWERRKKMKADLLRITLTMTDVEWEALKDLVDDHRKDGDIDSLICKYEVQEHLYNADIENCGETELLSEDELYNADIENCGETELLLEDEL